MAAFSPAQPWRARRALSQAGRRELGDRSIFLFHPPTPSCRDRSITGGTLQGDVRLRTLHGKGRVSARLGWAGEKSDFFSILLTNTAMAANRGSSKAPNRDLAPYNRGCYGGPRLPSWSKLAHA